MGLSAAVKARVCLEFKLLGPDGRVYSFLGLAEFARVAGLSKKKLAAVLHGRKESYKGWKRAGPALPKGRTVKKGLYPPFLVDGVEVEVDNLSKFCREQGLSYSTVRLALAEGRNLVKNKRVRIVYPPTLKVEA